MSYFISILGNNNVFPFKLPVTEDKGKDQLLYETYQGVIISVSVSTHI